MKRIDSRSNPTIKSICALKNRRNRQEQGLFCFEGIHLLEEAVRAGVAPCRVFVRDGCDDGYALAEKSGAEVISVSESVYDKLTEEKSPQGVFSVCPFLETVVWLDESNIADEIKKLNGTVLLLDSLQDCGNVGTVIRTAAALDVSVMLCGDCADVFSQKTVRATMGALFFSRILICSDTVQAVSALRREGRRVFAAALSKNGQVLGKMAVAETDCFVVGNEGNGVSRDAINSCTGTVIIPMTHRVESLNAASAASVIMWEARRGK